MPVGGQAAPRMRIVRRITYFPASSAGITVKAAPITIIQSSPSSARDIPPSGA